MTSRILLSVCISLGGHSLPQTVGLTEYPGTVAKLMQTEDWEVLAHWGLFLLMCLEP